MGNRTAEKVLGAEELRRLADGYYAQRAGAVAMGRTVEAPQEATTAGGQPQEMRFHDLPEATENVA